MPIEIKMPAITPDFDAGNISSWDIAVGDKVAKGDVLVAIETDKAVIEVEAESAGTLGQILIPAGTDDVPVHSLIGYLLIGDETIADLPSAKASGPAAATPEVLDINPESNSTGAVTSAPVITPTQPIVDNQSQRLFASPLARRIADQNQVDLQTLKGRGPRGRILRADV